MASVVDEDLKPRGLLFLRALRAAASRFPVWFVLWLVPLALGAALGWPTKRWFDDALGHRYEPGSVRAAFDETFLFDHREGWLALQETGALAAAPLALALMLFGIFQAGGWLQVFLERTSGHSLRRFLWGGARYFWRFLRVWILTIVTLALVSWCLYGWPWKTFVLDFLCGATGGDLDLFESERSVVRLEWLQAGLYAALFALVLAWGDYTRTRLALHGAYSSLWAGLCTWFLFLRHPIRTLRPLALILVVEVLVILLLGWFSWGRSTSLGPESDWTSLLWIFLAGQLAMIVQTLARGARYHAAVQLSRFLVPPLAEPDPWPKRVGGPGGPQYPIEETDEYGVSI